MSTRKELASAISKYSEKNLRELILYTHELEKTRMKEEHRKEKDLTQALNKARRDRDYYYGKWMTLNKTIKYKLAILAQSIK